MWLKSNGKRWIIYEQCLGGWMEFTVGNGLEYVDRRTVYNLALGVDWS